MSSVIFGQRGLVAFPLVVRASSYVATLVINQRMTKPTIQLMRPAKTQIRLRIRAVWSESSLIACAFHSLQAFQREINENPCRTGSMYRLAASVAQLDVRPTGDQEVAGSTPAKVGNILLRRLIMKYFLRPFSPFRWFKKGSSQFLAKECAQYWLTA